MKPSTEGPGRNFPIEESIPTRVLVPLLSLLTTLTIEHRKVLEYIRAIGDVTHSSGVVSYSSNRRKDHIELLKKNGIRYDADLRSCVFIQDKEDGK